MQQELVNGVELQVVSTQQFKTNCVVVSFVTELTSREETIMRTLLSNILETSSQTYPTQKDVALELSKMYGASFGTTVSRRGRLHTLSFIVNCVNDNYLLQPENMLAQVFSFLKEMIFAPLVEENAFDEVTFTRQKENLAAYIEAVKDNKQTYAALELQKMYFDDPIQKSAQYGDLADLTNITASELYSYYQKMLQQDNIQILVSGDVEFADVLACAKELSFEPRTATKLNYLYTQPRHESVLEKITQQTLNQSKLDLAYRLPVPYRGEMHYAALIFNALLGGSPQSKLFMNVREKASLAYYASSSFDPFRQLLVIQTGIKSVDKRRALALIKEQVADLAAGNFTLEELENIKLNLANSYESRLDSQMTALNRLQLEFITKTSESPASWLQKLNQVTKTEVMQVAQKVELQAIYFLDGGQE
ncbi:EF-P 5-aminopentanol modification-associated protein YfmF [Ligilactobacillus apodemi]|uniref:M16 family peptidase n=1 Tax=Ligilactobacillus apodemi DSM 16634 = JCM 16172 TaxID=1423724 RepID=A0A0R1TXL4_9LACO|nr:pitrilysin family protein [Ligilactobacillus apodemi]KRL83555.1 M16 family peptidase [Ligilactobacillus apodemi DSM 16634 = JCM 16172]MCR1900407.1 insulinase family protein [Ligilactobacillus apodemi]